MLIGFGMYSAFILIPQFVEAPTRDRLGFGARVTQAGLFLLPSTVVMLHRRARSPAAWPGAWDRASR